MSSEAETVGKQAVLAWKVDRGSYNGVSLDGLSVVAAVAGDKNLGIHRNRRRQGERPLGRVRRRPRQCGSADRAGRHGHRALEGQRRHRRQRHLRRRFSSPIRNTAVHVAAGQVALDVSKHIPHDPTCGAMQWFHPLVVDCGRDDRHRRSAQLHAARGLGTKWSDPNKRSAFFGTFAN